MPRHPRINAPDLLYHIISRGNNRQQIFIDKSDYEKFIKMLQETKTQYPFKLYGYVLMPNHFHLLVEVVKDPTSRIMQSLLTAYTKYYNYIHEKSGHLFQGRYKAILCDKDAYFMELVRYIHLNPIRAKLTKEPKDWSWSGHQEYSGKVTRNLIDYDLLIGVFGQGRAGYEEYVKLLENGAGRQFNKEYYPGEREPFLGDEKFVIKMNTRKVEDGKREKSLEGIDKEISIEKNIGYELIKGKRRTKEISEARIEFITRSLLEYGNSQASIARYLHCAESYITKVMRNRLS